MTFRRMLLSVFAIGPLPCKIDHSLPSTIDKRPEVLIRVHDSGRII